MNLLQEILSRQNGAIVQQLAGQFGLDGQQAQAAIGQLVPALARGIRNNASSGNGLQSLMGALQNGNHSRYVEQPTSLSDAATTQEGNGILGHIFGSKEVSREVANRASQQTGVGSMILKQMLPVLATAVMGAMSKQSSSASSNSVGGLLQGLLSAATGSQQSASAGSGALGMLNNFLDADNDGSALDDIMGMLAKRAG